MNRGVRIKTKPNFRIVALFIIILLVGIITTFLSLVLKEISIKIPLFIVGIVLSMISIFQFVESFNCYEEIDNNYFIVHRLFKKRTFPITEIKQILNTGIKIRLIDNNELEICNIDPKKGCVTPLLKALEAKGTEYLDRI